MKKITRYKRIYDIWYTKLLCIVSTIFKYENLPANLPSWEIEKRLITVGKCFVFKNKTYGVITSDGAVSGVNIYNLADRFNYAQSRLGSKSNLKDNMDGIIFYGSSADKLPTNGRGFIGRQIEYYADILTHIDLTRRIALISGRATNEIIAKSDNALRQLNDMYRALENGDLYVPKIDSGVLDATENIFKNVRSDGITLGEIDMSQQNVLKMFYSDFGITYATEKRERMITDEIAAEEDAMSVNVYDMLQCRKDGINKINSMFGTAITVNVNNDIVT